MNAPASIDQLLTSHQVDDPKYATLVVDGLIELAVRAGASDLHLQPSEDGLQLKWRIDGVLQPLEIIPKQVAGNVVVRLKVLAKLLT